MHTLERETVDSLGTTVDELVAIGRLLDNPRLARIWFRLHVEGNIITDSPNINFLSWDGMTVSELSKHLNGEIAQSTLYSDMNELEEIGAVSIESDSQPVGYSAKFFQADAEAVDDVEDGGIVGPQTIGLVGEAFVDDAVEQFIDTYKIGFLHDAMQIYSAGVRGRLKMNYTDYLPDVNEDDIKSIVPAIERVLLEMSRDPRWGEDFGSELDGKAEQ